MEESCRTRFRSGSVYSFNVGIGFHCLPNSLFLLHLMMSVIALCLASEPSLGKAVTVSLRASLVGTENAGWMLQ